VTNGKARVKPEHIDGGAVTAVTIDEQGTGYRVGPLVKFSGGGGTGAFATAEIDTSDPIGIATDWRVTLHELGGHGTLWTHVEDDQFKFAHSAGDSFAMILNDYLSEWHNNGHVPDRFLFLLLWTRTFHVHGTNSTYRTGDKQCSFSKHCKR